MAAALNNADADGRIIVDPSGPSLKFILLNAAAHFAKVFLSPDAIMKDVYNQASSKRGIIVQVLRKAHAVVLASGTLAPVASLQRQLFPDAPVRHFSCGHVIPPHRLLALALASGPSGHPSSTFLLSCCTAAYMLRCWSNSGIIDLFYRVVRLAYYFIGVTSSAGRIGSQCAGIALDFRHSQRANPATLDELGRILLNVCQAIPQAHARSAICPRL